MTLRTKVFCASMSMLKGGSYASLSSTPSPFLCALKFNHKVLGGVLAPMLSLGLRAQFTHHSLSALCITNWLRYICVG